MEDNRREGRLISDEAVMNEDVELNVMKDLHLLRGVEGWYILNCWCRCRLVRM